jgi:hypothetical protein
MLQRQPPPRLASAAYDGIVVLLTALALSIGWGVRGNWGHEYGAMIPGALAAMAVVLCSGRPDWHRRIAFFAFFGALGWSFGGSMSYMQVIAYTHSGHAATVLYGFACLFVLGFLWGAVGGAGTALPASLDRERLTELFLPVIAVMIAWCVQGIVLAAGQFDTDQLDWFDTDWLSALVAGGAVLALAAARRRFDWSSWLILWMVAGWWAGFLLLTVWGGLRMTPPRGDQWAGIVGMTAAMFGYLVWWRLYDVAWAGVVVGFFGGLGFSGSTFLKLMEVTSGYNTNWHSVLEQTFGFFAGIGVAGAMLDLSRRTRDVVDEPRLRRWTEFFCVAFMMLAITYLNIRKNVHAVWLPNRIVPAKMHGIAAATWFNLAYLAVAVVFLSLLVAHYRGRTIALLPGTWLGRGQLLFVLFLWWIVIGNLSRTVPFDPIRLVTEGVIHVNACLVTLLTLWLPQPVEVVAHPQAADYRRALGTTTMALTLAAVAIVLLEFGGVRAVWGDQFAGHGGLHIRFGPNATLDKR